MRQAKHRHITSPLDPSDIERSDKEGATEGEGEEKPYLSVVIPAYNEQARLPTTLDKVSQYLTRQPYVSELILVDDGSSDDTAALADEAAQRMGEGRTDLRVIRNPHRGKGFAVRTGVLEARGRYILYSDADLSAPIEEVEKLLPYLRARYHVAIGSREGVGAARYDEPQYRHLMGRVFNTLVRLVALPRFNDTQCGFKAFRGEVAHKLFRGLHLYGDNTGEVKGAMVTGFDVEVLYIALKWGYRVKEVPIRWYYSKGANVNPIKDSYRMLKDILKVRFNDLRGLYRKV